MHDADGSAILRPGGTEEEVLGESDLLDPERLARRCRPFNPLRLQSRGAE